MTTGLSADDFYLDESAPDKRVLLQAEVRNSERFIDMRYSINTGLGMRQAYELHTDFDGERVPVTLDPYKYGCTMEHTWGAPATRILQQYLDASSWDNLCDILAAYPGDIVELSAYDISVGVFGWNTLFWEVRGY